MDRADRFSETINRHSENVKRISGPFSDMIANASGGERLSLPNTTNSPTIEDLVLPNATEPHAVETTEAKYGDETEVAAVERSRDEWEPYVPNTLVSDFDSNPKLLWLYTLSKTENVVNKRDLKHAPLRTVFAVVDRETVGGPWRRVIISKV